MLMEYNRLKLKKVGMFLDKYYFIFIGIICLAFSIFAFAINDTQFNKAFIVFLTFAVFTCSKDIRRDVKWKPYIIASAPIYLFFLFISQFGYTIWHYILLYDWNKGIGIDLNQIFSKIPLNDAAFTRVFQPQWLTYYMRLVYNTGYIFSVTIPVCRAAVAKDLKKALTYACSAHIFQIFLILPFYRMIHLQEVWYVLKQPDGLARTFESEAIKASWVMHCFPSMHTSIAFAMFLVALREKDKIFKVVWSIYCLSIIYSTMYLRVHWTLDVLSGLVLGYVTVKLADFVLNKVRRKNDKYIDEHYYTAARNI